MNTGIDYEVRVSFNDGGKDATIGFAFCHYAKQFAGREFHTEEVKSVTVYDRQGKVWLHLVKNHPEKRENVPSPTWF